MKKTVKDIDVKGKKALVRCDFNVPMKDGVIADFDVSEHMLRYFIGKAARHSILTHLTVVIAVPYGINPVQRRAVEESAYRAGAQNVRIIFEPIASALGVGLPVGEPEASMIVDIGGGTTEVAVLSLGGIVAARSLSVGGDALERAIIENVKANYNLVISERTAEELKLVLASALPALHRAFENTSTMEVLVIKPMERMITMLPAAVAMPLSSTTPRTAPTP